MDDREEGKEREGRAEENKGGKETRKEREEGEDGKADADGIWLRLLLAEKR